MNEAHSLSYHCVMWMCEKKK